MTKKLKLFIVSSCLIFASCKNESNTSTELIEMPVSTKVQNDSFKVKNISTDSIFLGFKYGMSRVDFAKHLMTLKGENQIELNFIESEHNSKLEFGDFLTPEKVTNFANNDFIESIRYNFGIGYLVYYAYVTPTFTVDEPKLQKLVVNFSINLNDPEELAGLYKDIVTLYLEKYGSYTKEHYLPFGQSTYTWKFNNQTSLEISIEKLPETPSYSNEHQVSIKYSNDSLAIVDEKLMENKTKQQESALHQQT